MALPVPVAPPILVPFELVCPPVGQKQHQKEGKQKADRDKHAGILQPRNDRENQALITNVIRAEIAEHLN